MSGHEARAQRGQYGDPSLWQVVCPDGCPPTKARSKQDAEQRARLHQAQMLASRLRCECWDPDEIEMDPNGPCIACQLNDLLREAVAA